MPRGVPRNKALVKEVQGTEQLRAAYEALGAKHVELKAENELLRRMYTDASIALAYKNGYGAKAPSN